VGEGVRGLSAVRKKEEKRELMSEGEKNHEGGKNECGFKHTEGGGDKSKLREDARLGKVQVRDVGGEGGGVTGVSSKEAGVAGKPYLAAVTAGAAASNNTPSMTVTKLLRKYTSKSDDLLWARNGVIASVLYGESILVIQTQIEDAGFDDLNIIPLGADKVYIQCVSNTNVLSVFADAQDFYNLFFSKPVRWNQDVIKFERGALVRIYGIPIHAWNSELFKLAIFDSGRFLRLDDSTVSKDCFDYARVLLATSSLEVINFSERILIDGVIVELKIIEEWGFAIGEDACLLENDVVSNGSIPDNNFDNVARENCDQIDHLVNDIVDDWATDIDADNCQHLSKNPLSANVEVGNARAECDFGMNVASVSVVNVVSDQPKATHEPHDTINILNGEQQLGNKNFQEKGLQVETKPLGSKTIHEPQETINILNGGQQLGNKNFQEEVQVETQPLGSKKETCLRPRRQHSCPPRATRSITSGPWSIEWLQDHIHGDVGVVSSSKTTSKPKTITKAKPSKTTVKETASKERNTSSRLKHSLKHSTRNMKKIARLPVDNRNQVLNFLMKKVHRRRGSKNSDALTDAISKGSHIPESSSSTSVNNDWKNWVVLKGKDEDIKEDINSFGKSLGVKLYNDKANQFRLLSRGRKINKERVEEVKEGTHRG